MLAQIINSMNNILQIQQPAAVQPKTLTAVENPFASPFITVGFKQKMNIYKNQPVAGGYFAGYYNDKKNIVGKKLFIAV